MSICVCCLAEEEDDEEKQHTEPSPYIQLSFSTGLKKKKKVIKKKKFFFSLRVQLKIEAKSTTNKISLPTFLVSFIAFTRKTI